MTSWERIVRPDGQKCVAITLRKSPIGVIGVWSRPQDRKLLSYNVSLGRRTPRLGRIRGRLSEPLTVAVANDSIIIIMPEAAKETLSQDRRRNTREVAAPTPAPAPAPEPVAEPEGPTTPVVSVRDGPNLSAFRAALNAVIERLALSGQNVAVRQEHPGGPVSISVEY
jgi:hypothetical protein